MDELFFMLNNLPHLVLKNEEWNLLDYIINSLEEKSLIEFKKKWNLLKTEFHASPIQSSPFETICAYLDKWFQTTDILVRFNQNIASLWFEIHKSPINADELLDVTIELLSVDFNTLKLSLEKIEKAALIESRSQKGYALTMLHSAVRTKLSQLEFGKCMLGPGQYADKIKSAVIQFRQKQCLLILKRLCEKYLLELCENIEITIKENDELGYKFYFDNSKEKNKEKIIMDIIERLENNVSTLSCQKLITTAIQQYILIQDFIFTLKRFHYSYQEKLVEFSEKFDNFNFYIRNNPANETGFFYKVANNLFGVYNFFVSAKEEQFIMRIQQTIEKHKNYCVKSPAPSLSGIAN